MSDKTAHIVIHVDNKEKLLEALQKKISAGEAYAQACRQVLVEQYGADPAQINQQNLVERVTGYLIHCESTCVEPSAPAELMAEDLKCYSNYGLAKHGLTRAQYNKALAVKELAKNVRNKSGIAPDDENSACRAEKD